MPLTSSGLNAYKYADRLFAADANGYLQIPFPTPHYFVDSISGNNGNIGTTSSAPLQTIQAAIDAVYNAFPGLFGNLADGCTIFLARGTTHDISTSGINERLQSRSMTGPVVFSSYSPGGRQNVRPIIYNAATSSSDTTMYIRAKKNIVFDDLYFKGAPTVTGYNETVIARVDYNSENIYFHDCVYRYTRGLPLEGVEGEYPLKNIVFWRSNIYDARPGWDAARERPNGDCSGIYTAGTDGFLYHQSNFWRCGWNGLQPGPQTAGGTANRGGSLRNHNIYLNSNTRNAVLNEVVSAEASATGLQVRGGNAVSYNCSLLNNPINLTLGHDGPPIVYPINFSTSVHNDGASDVILRIQTSNTIHPNGYDQHATLYFDNVKLVGGSYHGNAISGITGTWSYPDIEMLDAMTVKLNGFRAFGIGALNEIAYVNVLSAYASLIPDGSIVADLTGYRFDSATGTTPVAYANCDTTITNNPSYVTIQVSDPFGPGISASARNSFTPGQTGYFSFSATGADRFPIASLTIPSNDSNESYVANVWVPEELFMVYGAAEHNIILGAKDVPSSGNSVTRETPRGWGLGFGRVGDMIMAYNIVSTLTGADDVRGFVSDPPTGSLRDLPARANKRSSVHHNIVYNTPGRNDLGASLYIQRALQPLEYFYDNIAFGSTSSYVSGFWSTSPTDNRFDCTGNYQDITYWREGGTSDNNPAWFVNLRFGASNTTTLSSYLAQRPHNGYSVSNPNFPNRTRNLSSYLTSISHSGTGDAVEMFMEELLNNRNSARGGTGWRTNYSAAGLNNYIREGFGVTSSWPSPTANSVPTSPSFLKSSVYYNNDFAYLTVTADSLYGVSGYKLEYGNSPDVYTETVTSATPNFSVLLSDGTYYGRVRAYNDAGSGVYTREFKAIVNGTPNIPPVSEGNGPYTVTAGSHFDTGANVILDSTGSYDPDGSIVSYQWIENSSLLATGPTASVFFSEGEHVVTLTVTDNYGAADTDTAYVTVIIPPAPSLLDYDDITVPVYDASGLTSKPLSFYHYDGIFTRNPFLFESNRPDSYFTGLGITNDEFYTTVNPICKLRVDRSGTGGTDGATGYHVSDFLDQAQLYVLAGFTGGNGENSISSWQNALTGSREQKIGKSLAYLIEMHTRYYNKRNLTYGNHGILLENLFNISSEHKSSTINSGLHGNADLNGPWLNLFYHPYDAINVDIVGRAGMATADAQNFARSSLFVGYGLSGAKSGLNTIFTTLKSTIDSRSQFTPGLTYPKFVFNNSDVRFPFTFNYNEDVNYSKVLSLEISGAAPSVFTLGVTSYETPIYGFTSSGSSIPSKVATYRKYLPSAGITGNLEIIKSGITGVYSTWGGLTGYIAVGSTGGTKYPIVSTGITTQNYTRSSDNSDSILINSNSPYYFVKLDSSLTSGLGLASAGVTTDRGMWIHHINDPRARTYKFFDRYTLFDLWGSTGPYIENGTTGSNYSPNQLRMARNFNGPTSGSGTLLQNSVNLKYNSNSSNSLDTNPDFINFFNSLCIAQYQYLMSKSFEGVKTIFPGISIIGDSSIGLGSKNAVGLDTFRNAMYTYEADLISGLTGNRTVVAGATGIFGLSGVGVNIAFGHVDKSECYNSEFSESFAGLNGNILTGIYAGIGSGSSNYRALAEKISMIGQSGLSGSHNLAGNYKYYLSNGITSIPGDSVENQTDVIRLRYKYNQKLVDNIYTNLNFFNETRNAVSITPTLSESEGLSGQGNFTGPTGSRIVWNDILGNGFTSVLHVPSEYDYFTLIREMAWNYNVNTVLIKNAKNLINRPSYLLTGTAGATGISGAIKIFGQNDGYSRATVGNYIPGLNFSGLPAGYGLDTLPRFTGSPTGGTAPVTVHFDASTSYNPSGTYIWYFKGSLTGPSASYTGATASYTYSTTGNFDVRMIAQNAYSSNELLRSNYINVFTEPEVVIPLPISDFGASPTGGVSPLSVVFTDRSIQNADYPITLVEINYGPEGFSGIYTPGMNFYYTYTQPGSYDVTLTVYNAGGFSTKTYPNLITVIAPSPTGSTGGGNTGPGVGPGNTAGTDPVRGKRIKINHTGKVISINGKLYDIAEYEALLSLYR